MQFTCVCVYGEIIDCKLMLHASAIAIIPVVINRWISFFHHKLEHAPPFHNGRKIFFVDSTRSQHKKKVVFRCVFFLCFAAFSFHSELISYVRRNIAFVIRILDRIASGVDSHSRFLLFCSFHRHCCARTYSIIIRIHWRPKEWEHLRKWVFDGDVDGGGCCCCYC